MSQLMRIYWRESVGENSQLVYNQRRVALRTQNFQYLTTRFIVRYNWP